MLKNLEFFALGLSLLTLLGVHLQTLGSKTNTSVRVIDLLSNLLVIIFFFLHLPTPLKILFGIWAWKCFLNIYPLGEAFCGQVFKVPDVRVVEESCDRAKHWFRVPDLKTDTPSLYVCNHALGSLDDIVAIGALTDVSLSVLINGSPSGLGVIPPDCRSRLCVLPPGKKRYERTREILREEILDGGKSMIVFPEDMMKKKSSRSLAPLRTGVINLCWEMGIPVIPLWLDWPTQFPSVFANPRKTLSGRRTSRPLYPKNFSNSVSFHREIQRKLEKLM